MRLFRRNRPEEAEEESAEEQEENLTPDETTQGESQRWFQRLRQRTEATTAGEEAKPAGPERKRRRSPDDPLSVDEAMEPPSLELAGSRRFTVVVGPAREPDAPPIDLPPVLGERRRRWVFGRRPDPLDEIMAAVPLTTDLEEPAEPETVEPVETEPAAIGPRLPWEMRWGLLAAGVVLLVVAVLHVLGAPGVLDLWPLAVIAAGVVVMPGAIRRAHGNRLMTGFGLIAIGAGVMLAQEAGLPVETVLSIALLIAFGAAVLVRSLLVSSNA